MFRETKKFTIIPLGYERTTPMLTEYNRQPHIRKVIENIRTAPDFALITENKQDALLVEVKYRHTFKPNDVLAIISDLYERWDQSFLFLANKDKFYFASCETIIGKNGFIDSLDENWIDRQTQEKYHALLREFVCKED